MNLKKLTIVIFTYNRHKYLKRTVKYWLNYNIKLLILDGSQVKLEDSCLKSKNITYINKDKLKSKDIGPGNVLIDSYLRKTKNLIYSLGTKLFT